MIKLFSIKLIVISLIYVNSSLAQVNNTIIAKIDKEIITSHDLHDEIKTIMLINKIEITNG